MLSVVPRTTAPILLHNSLLALCLWLLFHQRPLPACRYVQGVLPARVIPQRHAARCFCVFNVAFAFPLVVFPLHSDAGRRPEHGWTCKKLYWQGETCVHVPCCRSRTRTPSVVESVSSQTGVSTDSLDTDVRSGRRGPFWQRPRQLVQTRLTSRLLMRITMALLLLEEVGSGTTQGRTGCCCIHGGKLAKGHHLHCIPYTQCPICVAAFAACFAAITHKVSKLSHDFYAGKGLEEGSKALHALCMVVPHKYASGVY